MDTKIEIKEEDPHSDNVASQNETKFFTKSFTMKTNSDALFLGDRDVAFKREIKSDTPFPEFCFRKERDCFTKHFKKQIKCETLTCSKNWEIDMKTEVEEQTLVSDFSSQNDRKFLSEDAVMKIRKYNSHHEMDNKIEIKDELCWLETETSSVCEDIKDRDFLPVKYSRSFTEVVFGDSSDKSPVPSPEVLGSDTSFYNAMDCPECEGHVREIPTVEEHVHSEQFGKCSDGGNIYSKALCFKQNNLIHNAKLPHKCNICEKSFTYLSHLRNHEFVHGGERPHRCKICDKGFSRLTDLKRHILIHEGKKPHQCKTCDKSFSRLSSLKMHNLMHAGTKPHQCKICDKSFPHLSNLKVHNLIHEGKKPHQCKTCDKSFIQLSCLKIHNLIHEGKKPHQCKTCDKSFTLLSNLKRHNLVHEGKKPHQCNACDKSFTVLSNLKRHNLIHEGKKLHQCKTCDKSFTQLSNLKRHNLVHEGKKPHQCKTCDKSFIQLSDLKNHNLIHEGKKPHQCKTCDKSFTQLSNLKRHNLVHEVKKL